MCAPTAISASPLFLRSNRNCKQGFLPAAGSTDTIFSWGAFTSQFSQWMVFLGCREPAFSSCEAPVSSSPQAAQMHPHVPMLDLPWEPLPPPPQLLTVGPSSLCPGGVGDPGPTLPYSCPAKAHCRGRWSSFQKPWVLQWGLPWDWGLWPGDGPRNYTVGVRRAFRALIAPNPGSDLGCASVKPDICVLSSSWHPLGEDVLWL